MDVTNELVGLVTLIFETLLFGNEINIFLGGNCNESGLIVSSVCSFGVCCGVCIGFPMLLTSTKLIISELLGDSIIKKIFV